MLIAPKALKKQGYSISHVTLAEMRAQTPQANGVFGGEVGFG